MRHRPRDDAPRRRSSRGDRHGSGSQPGSARGRAAAIARDTLLAEGEDAAGAFGAWLDAHPDDGFLGPFTGILVTGTAAEA
jgi:hypothetical protein